MTKAIAWKTERTVYFTRILARPNRYGNIETACVRKEVYWNARSADGKQISEGHATRRDALAAIYSHSAMACSICGKPATLAVGPANEPICAKCEAEMMVQLP